jgi:hypothetical protein
LPPMIYTLKISVKHFESVPTQIRRVTVTDRRKYGIQTEDSDVVLSSSEEPTAPNFAHSSAVAVPLGSFNDFAQVSPLDASFSVADALASKASRATDSKVDILLSCDRNSEQHTHTPPHHRLCSIWPN